MNIGLFYGSSTCYTEMAAEKIRDIIGPELITLHNLKDDSPALMEQYDVLILGIPTWDFGEIQEDWEAVWAQLDTLNLTEEQREIIEEAFEAQSAAEAEYATESYFCGIADCIRFLKYIEGPRGE